MAKIVEGLDLRGLEVLDIGTGIGGPACLLVEAHDAGHVTSIDVEEPVLARAAAAISERGLVDRIELKKVRPGPLPFPDEHFDLVFSKDSIIHIQDKTALYADIFRALNRAAVSRSATGSAPTPRRHPKWLNGWT